MGIKLKKQFEEFHNEIKIVYGGELVKKRDMFEEEIKNNLPDILKEHDISVKKTDINFFIQGSCATKTLIDTNGDIDLDLAIELPIDIDVNNDCRKVKGYVRDSIDKYNRTIDFKRPCITVDYQSDEMHIDLPVYAKNNNQLYLAIGKEQSDDYEWQKCDPKGLNDYFKDNLENNSQLRRMVRYLKKWKSISFNDDNSMPPSIALTILACRHFASMNQEDDLTVFYNIVKGIYNEMSNDEAPYFYVYLPKQPYSDTMFKINRNKEYRKLFKTKMKSLLNNLTNAMNSSDDYTAGTYLQKIYGDIFPLPEKEVDSSSENKYRRTSHFG